MVGKTAGTLSGVRGASKRHCLHFPFTLVVQTAARSRCSSQPARATAVELVHKALAIPHKVPPASSCSNSIHCTKAAIEIHWEIPSHPTKALLHKAHWLCPLRFQPSQSVTPVSTSWKPSDPLGFFNFS